MRIYATDDEGKRYLVAIECDFCDARIKPHSEIAESGWRKFGAWYGYDDWRNTETCLCPKHAYLEPESIDG